MEYILYFMHNILSNEPVCLLGEVSNGNCYNLSNILTVCLLEFFTVHFSPKLSSIADCLNMLLILKKKGKKIY